MQAEALKIINTTSADLPTILWLFEQAMKLQGKGGYKVWKEIDKSVLMADIENKFQYKITRDDNILCIFSILPDDPFIWRERDNEDAVYLHRIVVNPHYKGQRTFEIVLNWTRQFAIQNKRRYIRMDTWADNEKIIAYYQSFGFKFIQYYKTPDNEQLPVQNRNLNVALLEMDVNAAGN